jgi:hypothetical protein
MNSTNFNEDEAVWAYKKKSGFVSVMNAAIPPPLPSPELVK